MTFGFLMRVKLKWLFGYITFAKPRATLGRIETGEEMYDINATHYPTVYACGSKPSHTSKNALAGILRQELDQNTMAPSLQNNEKLRESTRDRQQQTT